jgi:hypothetical protein
MDAVAELQQLPDHWERAPHGTAHWLLRACHNVHIVLRRGVWGVWVSDDPSPEHPTGLDHHCHAAYTLADATSIAAELSAYTHESY